MNNSIKRPKAAFLHHISIGESRINKITNNTMTKLELIKPSIN